MHRLCFSRIASLRFPLIENVWFARSISPLLNICLKVICMVTRAESCIKAYFNRGIAEIANDRALSLYGIALALTHVFTIYYWHSLLFAHSYFNDAKAASGPICWSFTPWCRDYDFPLALTFTIGVAYLAVALATIALFYSRRVRAAWFGLLAMTAIKYFLLTIDYRSMGNYHYMSLALCLVYLFVPNRSVACRMILVAIYFAAGLLKFNFEWLSGSALLRNPGISAFVLQWLCAYVVVLESCLVFGVFAVRSWVRWATYAQLMVFHIFSFWIVGYFYPCVSICLLAVFPLSWRWSDNPLRISRVHYAMLALFAVLQLIPKLQAGDPSLVGRGRLFGLNMLDATVDCRPQFFVRSTQSSYEMKVPNRHVIKRISCDPLVFWNFGRELCRKNSGRPDFEDIDFLLAARRSTDTHFSQIVSVSNFCRNALSYQTLLPNKWNEAE